MVDQFDQERFANALKLLRDDINRQIRVKIDNETLGGAKAEQEMNMRLQFLEAVGNYFQGSMGVIEKAPNFQEVLSEMLMFGVRGFPVGRTMEHSLQAALDKVAAEGMGTPPPQGNKSAGEIDLEKQKLDLEVQRLKLEQRRMLVDEQRVNMEMREKQGRLHVDAQSRARDAQSRDLKMQLDAQKDMANVEAQKENEKLRADVAVRGQDLKHQEKLFDLKKGEFDLVKDSEERDIDRQVDVAKHTSKLEFDAEEKERDRQAQIEIAHQRKPTPNEGAGAE